MSTPAWVDKTTFVTIPHVGEPKAGVFHSTKDNADWLVTVKTITPLLPLYRWAIFIGRTTAEL